MDSNLRLLRQLFKITAIMYFNFLCWRVPQNTHYVEGIISEQMTWWN